MTDGKEILIEDTRKIHTTKHGARRLEKVIVIGCSGSGKSTFARKLSAITNLPLYYLDMIWYKPDKTTLTEDEFDKRVSILLQKDKWIIDGDYKRTLEIRLIHCDTVFLLDIPTHICLESARSRIGKQRVDLPWLETEFEEDFKQWICNYQENSLPQILTLLEKHKDGKQIVIFKTRKEIDDYLKRLMID